MKKHIIASILILAVVGCAANGVVQQALMDAGGGLVWKVLASDPQNVDSHGTSYDESVPRWVGTDGHYIEKTNVYVDDTDHVGVNSTSSATVAARLHVREDGSSVLCPTNTVLALQNNNGSSDNVYSVFCSGSTGKSVLYFGDSSVYGRGLVEYDCATDDMRLFATDDIKLEADNINLSAPTGETYINSGQRLKRASKSANYTIVTSDYYIGVTTSGNTITLPSASAQGIGKAYVIKAEYTGVGSTTVNATSGNVDGSGSITLGTLRAAEFISDGTNWWTF